MNLKQFPIGAALTLVMLAAQAATPSAPPKNRLQAACMAADVNHDGSVSLEEFHHDIVKGWRALLPGSDGFVSLKELGQVPGMNRRHLERLQKADTDKDDKLSFKEVVEARMAYFDAADTDKNDAIALQECVDHERKLRRQNDGADKSSNLKGKS